METPDPTKKTSGSESASSTKADRSVKPDSPDCEACDLISRTHRRLASLVRVHRLSHGLR